MRRLGPTAQQRAMLVKIGRVLGPVRLVNDNGPSAPAARKATAKAGE
jgi:hypothetical protein